MADTIPEEKILEIRNAVDIVDLVSESVILKKAGKNFVGLCPFHAEKTPSFTVSAEKQIFYCFGCGAGGNVFRFSMKRDGLSFPEAVRMLAGRAGVELPQPHLSSGQKRRLSENERLLRINREAADFYHHCLMTDRIGRRPMAYLRERGVSLETIREFQLGYAPAGWDALIQALGRKGVAPALLEKGGLAVSRKDRSGFYDRFRDRIVFPIRNPARQVIGFGGRVMDDALPKYLNSPETPVYSKGRCLYGLDLARDACRQAGTVFIVEGYLDLLALFQNGIRNAVATLGTALTESHLLVLKGLATTVYLVFDSDAAGLKAALRSADLFIRESVDARIVVLPSGEDPDSLLRSEGPAAFRLAAGKASAIFSFLIDSAIGTHGLSTAGKVRIVEEVIPALAGIEDPVVRSLYVKELSERVGVDEGAVLERLRAAGPRVKNQAGRASPPSRGERAPAPDRGAKGARYRLEERIVAMVLQFPEMLAEVESRRAIEHFEDADLQAIGRVVLAERPRSAAGNAGTSAVNLVEKIQEERQRRIAARLAIGEDRWDHAGCLRLLDQYDASRRRKKDPLLAKIRQAEEAGDHELLLQLLKDKQRRAASASRQRMSSQTQ